MFDFGTSSGQVLDQNCGQNGTSSGQAVVPKYKHTQTITNNKNLNKPQIFENSEIEPVKIERKQKATVSYTDNLKTSKDKDYNEPL